MTAPDFSSLPSGVSFDELLEELMEAIAVGADTAEECRAYADEIERRVGYDSSLARALREVADLYDRASKLVPEDHGGS